MLNNNEVHWSVHEPYLIILCKIKQKNHKENLKKKKNIIDEVTQQEYNKFKFYVLIFRYMYTSNALNLPKKEKKGEKYGMIRLDVVDTRRYLYLK